MVSLLLLLVRKPCTFSVAARQGYAAGAACKAVEARKTRMAAPVSFSGRQAAAAL